MYSSEMIAYEGLANMADEDGLEVSSEIVDKIIQNNPQYIHSYKRFNELMSMEGELDGGLVRRNQKKRSASCWKDFGASARLQSCV